MRTLIIVAALMTLTGCPEDDESLRPIAVCYELELPNGEYAVVADGVKARLVDANGQPIPIGNTYTLRERRLYERGGQP